MLGEPRAAPASIHCLLPDTAFSRSAASIAYLLCPWSTAISTTEQWARSTAARRVSRYFGSVEGKIGLHGSMWWTLNFSATCAAKSVNCICCAAGTLLGVFPSQPFHPTMNSRNGYAATATLFRGSEGNFTAGPVLEATAAAGNNHASAAAVAHCSTNCLRVTFMR